jgi:hypothetical protein
MSMEEIVINLILAVNANDLVSTVEYVNLFNENYDILPLETNIEILLDIHTPENYGLDNQAIDYVLRHLKGLSRPELARWTRDKYKLLLQNNKGAIKNFINEQLRFQTYGVEENLFIQGLIQLVVKTNDRDYVNEVLNLLKDRIRNIEEV